MTTSMSLAQAKAHLSEVVGRVGGQHERITVTVHGRPAAVLIAPEDLESLEETLAILSDADAMRRLAAADAELADGKGESEADLAAATRRRRQIGGSRTPSLRQAAHIKRSRARRRSTKIDGGSGLSRAPRLLMR